MSHIIYNIASLSCSYLATRKSLRGLLMFSPYSGDLEHHGLLGSSYWLVIYYFVCKLYERSNKVHYYHWGVFLLEFKHRYMLDLKDNLTRFCVQTPYLFACGTCSRRNRLLLTIPSLELSCRSLIMEPLIMLLSISQMLVGVKHPIPNSSCLSYWVDIMELERFDENRHMTT